MNHKQSWPSAFVDTAIIMSVVALCFVPNVSPMAWSVLGQIALVRFGVAVTKQALGNMNSGSGGNGSPPSDPGRGQSDPPTPMPQRRKQQDTPPADTLRRVAFLHAAPALAILLAMIVYSLR